MTLLLSFIHERMINRRGIILTAVSYAALSWSFCVSGAEPNLSAREIIERMGVHADDYWDLTRGYTFLVDIMVEDYESDDSLKKRITATERLYHFYGRRFFRRLKMNGKSLDGKELKKENLRESKFRERTRKSVAKADSSDLHGRMDRTAIKIADLIDRYTYELAGVDTLQGRDVYVIHFTPKPDLKAENRRDKIFNQLAGTAWIDMVQFRIVKAVGRLVNNVRIGWIAANITHVEINYGQQEITPGVWMPRYVDARVAGSIFFFKKINRYTTADFYEYIKAEEAPPGLFEQLVAPIEETRE